MSLCQIGRLPRNANAVAAINAADYAYRADQWDQLCDERTARIAVAVENLRLHIAELDAEPIATSEDAAWEVGYRLGSDGHEVGDVEADEAYTESEATAFHVGVARGASDRWAAYGQWKREREAMDWMYDTRMEPEAGELCEARMA